MKRQSGFSMLEVLISLLVLSIGLLGMAGLQMNALKFNHTASVRSQATVLAYEIGDRMRMNRKDALDGKYAISLTATSASGSTRASADLSEWKQSLARHLPDGRGAVQTSGNIVTVTVQWDESRLRNGSASQQFIFETRL